jgi:hypothetical protein
MIKKEKIKRINDTTHRAERIEVGDKNVSIFKPAFHFKDKERYFKLGLKDTGGTVKIKDDTVEWKKGDMKARFYSYEKEKTKHKEIRYINRGTIDIQDVPPEYELSNNFEMPFTIVRYETVGIIQVGEVLKSTYLKDNLPVGVCRVPAYNHNPTYCDENLTLFDMHFSTEKTEWEIAPELAFELAMIEEYGKLGRTLYRKGSNDMKLYEKINGDDVKVYSTEMNLGHKWGYINRGMDYNIINQYRKGKISADLHAFPPSVSDHIPDLVIASAMEKLGLKLKVGDYTQDELYEMQKIKQHSNTADWINNSKRSDVYGYKEDI